MSILDPQARKLLLACEIAGYLHDLGKLHPGFAREKLDGETPVNAPANRPSTRIGEAHGRILEEGRVYPESVELADSPELSALLTLLKNDPAWAAALALPSNLVHPGTIQAEGLGMALRQHHAQPKFPEKELSLLGDIYMFAADIRDSAFDKGSGGTKDAAQQAGAAEIIDAFGHQRGDYSAAALQTLWQDAVARLHELLAATEATVNLADTRQRLLETLKPLLLQALGETRRPTHDVTLHHHALATASFFKAAVAEGLLRQDFGRWQDENGLFDIARMGQLRFRLLGIRWDWTALTRGMLSAAALVSLSGRRREVVENLRELFERDEAVGNLIYEDDDGVLVLLPGFHAAADGEDEPAASEQLFAEKLLDPLQNAILDALRPLGTGTAVELCWSRPALYLTDYADALGVSAHPRRRALQVGVDALRQLWDEANASSELMQICPQCGLRPAATREFALSESSLRNQELCAECAQLTDVNAKRSRGRRLADEFGFRTSSFNISELARHGSSSRIALFAVSVDTTQIADGRSFITQLARPVHLLKEAAAGIEDANALGDWFQSLLGDLAKGVTIPDERAKLARELLGDPFWLKKNDGRAASALEVARLFFLRESAALPAEWQLIRHDGDRLALFALRKHASPARLQRLWDNLRDFWRELAQTIATDLQDNFIPLSLDARGLRFAVAASAADSVVRHIQAAQSQTFSKLRGGLALHVSCVVTMASFPLYLSLDALGRMERRIPHTPHQTWRLVKSSGHNQALTRLVWQTPQGMVHWNVDTATADPDRADQWHSHFILSQHGGQPVHGPARLVHVSRLQSGDEVLIPPATFDFMTLEGSGRRHQLAYVRDGETLRRPHWVLGPTGQTPLLLDTYTDFAALLKTAGWDTGKAKRLMGEMVETYEKWVRDTPASLRDTGQQAWHAHLRNMLQRYASSAGTQGQQQLFDAITAGRFFDAIEWLTFIGKTSASDPSSPREARA